MSKGSRGREPETPSAAAAVASGFAITAGVLTLGVVLSLWFAGASANEIFNQMEPVAMYAYISFCLTPLIFPCICIFSPWPQTVWDYLYTFVSGSLYCYPIPSVAIISLAIINMIMKIWQKVPMEFDLRITSFVIILLVVTPAFLSYAMASFAQRERLSQPQYYVDFSPLSLTLASASALFMLLKAMEFFSSNSLIFYVVFPIALASLVFAWLGLLTNIVATKLSGIVWCVVAFFIAFAVYFFRQGIVLF